MDISINDNDNDSNDVIICHEEYYETFYHYECGKSFLEICVEMGIDLDDTNISLL